MADDALQRRLVEAIRFGHRVRRFVGRLFGAERKLYVDEMVAQYQRMWQDAAAEEAVAFVPLSSSIWELRIGDEVVSRIRNYVLELDDPVTLDVAGDKALTYRLLAGTGLTIPRYRTFTLGSLSQLASFVAEVKPPFVVKPARNTSSGLGVTTHLETLSECLWAAALASTYCEELIVEQHVAGESYRLLFLGNELLCASRRSGLRVTSDGKTPIADLLRTQHGSAAPSGRSWREDADVLLTLRSQNFSPDTIPSAGSVVLVRSSRPEAKRHREVRTIYTEDVMHLVCDEVVREARAASMALRSEFCGVDVITVDPSVPFSSSRGAINEVNTTPGLHHHYGIASVRPREEVAAAVLRYVIAKRRSEQRAGAGSSDFERHSRLSGK